MSGGRRSLGKNWTMPLKPQTVVFNVAQLSRIKRGGGLAKSFVALSGGRSIFTHRARDVSITNVVGILVDPSKFSGAERYASEIVAALVDGKGMIAIQNIDT